MNQKICCESGKVRVSYKIPTMDTFINDTTLFKANLRQSFIYSDEEALGIDDAEPYTGELIVVDSETNIYGSTFPLTCLPNDYSCVERYLKAPFDLSFFEFNGESSSRIGSIDISLSKDDYIGSDGRAYGIGGWLYPRSNIDEVNIDIREDGAGYIYESLAGGYNPPFLHKYSCEITGYTPYSFLDGNCVYPDRWEYFDVENPKFNIRDGVEKVLKWLEIADNIRLLDPFDPAIKNLELILEGIKRFSLLRTCVIAGEQFLNSNQINIALGLEIGVLENIEIPFLGLESQINFWQPVPGFDQIIKTLESPPGCPPPLVKLECCPETGCREECPAGTCEVECGDFICCYDKNGKSIKRILK